MQRVKGEQLKPNVIPYGPLISAHEQAEQWEKASFHLLEAQVRMVHINILTYTAAVGSCEKSGNWHFAYFLLISLHL